MDAGGNNDYDIVVTASDGLATHNVTQAVVIRVTDANDNAPVFDSGATATTPENVSTTTAVYTAHATDSDGTPANNTVSYSLAAGTGDNDLFSIDATTGAVTFKSSPDYEKAADADHNNVYDIVVTASDGLPAHDATQAVAITVTDVNDNAPIFTSGSTAATSEGIATTTTVYVANASDADGTSANATVRYSLAAGVGDNNLFAIDATSGAVTFKASPDYENPADAGANNVYNIVVTASDGLAAHDTTQAVAITVSDLPPVFSSPADSDPSPNQSYSNAPQGASTGVTAASMDPAGGSVTYSLMDNDNGHFQIDATSGIVTVGTVPIAYDTANPANNTRTIVVAASDPSGQSTTHDFTITISPDAAPTNTVPATTQTTAEDTPKQITGVSVADVDSTNLTTTLSVIDGSVHVTAGGGATITNNDTGTVTVAGTAAQINNALAGLTYTNTPDYNGSDTLKVATSDGSLTTTNTVAITVTPVQDAFNDTATAITATPKPIDVNANDTFENTGHMITAIAGTPITTNGTVATTHGSVTLQPDGTLTYTSAANYTGHDIFSYTVTSGGVTETASVDVTVVRPNTPPTANNITAPGFEDQPSAAHPTPLAVNLSATDPDAGDSVASYKLGSLPTNGTLYTNAAETLPAATNTAYTSNTFYFKPTANYSGSTSFTYTATDTHGATSNVATATIDVAPVADQAGTPAFGDFTPTATSASAFLLDTPSSRNELGNSVVARMSGGFLTAHVVAPSSDAFSVSIIAQRFDNNGKPVHQDGSASAGISEFYLGQAPNDDSVGYYNPHLTSLPSGGLLVTFDHFDQAGNNDFDIYGEFVSANGTVGPQFQISAPDGSGYDINNPLTQDQNDAARLTGGTFVVTYEKYTGYNTETADIYAQRLSSTGATIGSEFMVNTQTANGQNAAHVTALNDGGFLVVWQSNQGTANGGADIHAQRFDVNGVKVGSEFTVNTTTAGNQNNSVVTGLASGGWVVSWESDTPASGNTSDADIYARVYNANGTAATGQFLVTPTTNGQQTVPTVLALPDDGFLIEWNVAVGAGSSDVYGQRFNAAGVKVGGAFLVDPTTGNGQTVNDEGLALLANGSIATVYHSTADQDPSGRIFIAPGDGAVGTATTLTTLNTTPSADTDGSETLSYHITGFDPGTTFNYGSSFSSTEWVISDPNQISALKSNPLIMTSATAGIFTLKIDAQETDTATLSTGPATDVSHSMTTLTVGIKAAADPVFAAHDAGTFDLHLSPVSAGNTVHVEALPDDGKITYADGTSVKAGATLTAGQLAGLKFTPLDDGADHASNFVYSVSDGSSVDTQTLPINVQHGSNLTLTGTAEKDVLVGGAGHDTLIGNGGGNFLTGGGGADTFVFEAHALAGAKAAVPLVDHVTDYSAAQGDVLDFSALFSSVSHPSAHAATLVHAVEDASGTAAAVSINVAGPDAPAHWVEIAHLDGVPAGRTVDLALDAAHPHQISHIHVDAMA